ncbi:MAG: Rab family GTPase [Candidatus Hodarchaeales archaeon]
MKIIPSVENKPLKIVILGEGGVGKTTISKTFTKNTIFEETKQTIAVEFHSKVIDGDKDTKIQIWDLGGQQQFKNMGVFREFCKGSDVAILCFELTDLSSLFSLSEWINFIDVTVPRFLIGTKADIASLEERLIDLTVFEERFKCLKSFKCSSKDVHAVSNIFQTIIGLTREFQSKKVSHESSSLLSTSKQFIMS